MVADVDEAASGRGKLGKSQVDQFSLTGSIATNRTGAHQSSAQRELASARRCIAAQLLNLGR
jgi:hypothetical protein